MNSKDARDVLAAFKQWCSSSVPKGEAPTVIDAMGFFIETRKETSPLYRWKPVITDWAEFFTLVSRKNLIK